MYVGDTVTGAVICFSDISERKRTQEWMQRLSLAVEQSPVSIAISNANGEFTYVNPCLSSATGYGLNDLRTASLLKPNAHKSNDQVLSDIRKYLANGEQWRSEVLVGKKAGGSFLADLVVSPIIDFQGAIVSHLWIFENVTEQRRLENELRQAQKMESLGQLTGGVAHDFNNILAVVLTNAEILSDDLEGDSLSAPVVAAIIRAVYRGSALTERLLAFSRRSELSPTPTDVSAVVTDMRDMLQRSLGETISVEVEAESGLPSVVLDQSQFENALVNLSVNARDAMPSGGRLYLEVTRGSPRSNTGKDELNGGVPHVCVSVSDTGCGIPTSLLERIYEPFFTTKKKGEGTGFGLSMVYGFVKQSGGEIRVDSTEGVGTTFRLFFPACSDGGREFHVDRPVQAAALSDYKPLSALNILLVEDDEHVRDSTKMMLRGDGHTVSAASAGEEALECLKTSPDIEWVIADVVMPGKINGRDLAFEARKIRPDIKLLFTSGYSAGRLSEEDLHKFQAKFLPKPYSKNDLDEAIAELISGRR